VTGPNFDPPELDNDWVVLGCIASKSAPRSHKDDNRGKYMVMSLTDLKWELELFLFDTGFERFWKLSPGTVIAILNPNIMKPLPGRQNTGKFSLSLNSSDNTILEIGTARDLGFCKSVKKDGKMCDTWIDKRHTEYCEYHVNESLRKVKAGRMEVNSMDFGPRTGSRSGLFPRIRNKSNNSGLEVTKRGLKEEGASYDKSTHSNYHIAPGRSTASLLDDNDVDPDAFHRGTSKEERNRRRLAEKEHELDIARKLGSFAGGSVGGEYLRAQHQNQNQGKLENNGLSDMAKETADAKSLGLLSANSDSVHLSPIKRKRANTVSSTAAVGWGKELTKELNKRKNPDASSTPHPARKKTRFLTEKGIREAGRESFGGSGGAGVADFALDDDDDLDIVK